MTAATAKSILRPHQEEAMQRLRASIGSGKRRPVMQAPTGFGKTVLASAIVEGALAKGKRTVFVVPALSLIDQTVQMFWREGIREVGVIQADHVMTDYSKPVQVASVQTLARRDLPRADVVVIDECHRLFKSVSDWIGHPDWQRVPFIGLSATPWTRGLGRYYDDLIIASTTAELIAQGYLSPFRVFAPAHPDLSKVRTVAGDFHEGDLSDAMNKPTLVADVVSTWLERGERRPTLCFGVDCAHAQHLQQLFEQAGVPCGYQDAYTDSLEREEIKRKFHRGEYEVVCNVGTLTTGIDWDVRCIILARPTKSEILFVQIIGRGLRTAEGKADCLILDHSDTTLRLGFVTDIHHEELDNGDKGKKKEKRTPPLPKECPKCAYLKPAKVRKCPACGFEPERQHGVDYSDGELTELKAGGERGQGKRPPTREDKQRWYSGFVWVSRDRGYKPGWASHKFKEKFGVWPNGLDPIAATPDYDILSYIKSRQIAYAKAKAKAAAGAPNAAA